MKRHLNQWAFGIAALLACAAMPGEAQSNAPFPVTIAQQLAARASNYTEVTLDRKMLDFAKRFMNKEDDAEGKRIIEKLNGVYVRTYEFDKPGQYTPEELEAIRHQVLTSEWSPMVKSRSKNGSDDSDIYMKLVNGEVRGMFILNAEPRELNFVYIDGPIRPEDLADLGGNFGIPSGLDASKDKAEKAEKKAEKAAQKANHDAQKAAQDAQKAGQP